MIHEIWTFLKRHWVHLLLFVPGAVLVTLLHEAAHAVAAYAQGGTLVEFAWLPGAGEWGHVAYDFAEGAPYSGFAISIAPYVLWVLLATVALLLSLRGRKYARWQASTLYLWLFVVPLADIANAAFPYLTGKENDFLQAFGPPSSYAAPLTALACMLAVLLGYGVQRRLYREDGLSMPSYGVLSLAALAVIGMLTGMIF